VAALEPVRGLRGISRGQVTRSRVTAVPDHRTILGLMWWTSWLFGLFAVVGLPFGPTGRMHPREAEPGWQNQCDAADAGHRVSKQGRALGSPRPPQ
jgi:hypothetical protein